MSHLALIGLSEALKKLKDNLCVAIEDIFLTVEKVERHLLCHFIYLISYILLLKNM